MTAEVSSPYSGAPADRHTRGARVAVAVLGIAAVVVGGFLLFHPYSAARTLALFVGLALVVGGVLEMGAGWASGRQWGSFVVGAILVVGGLLAAFWPGVTLSVIAVITGISLIAHGVGRLALAFMARSEVQGWGWLALAGAVNLLVGILAIAWPDATILVLSLVLGAQILVFGVILTVAALWRPRTPAAG